ncbi:unnamed protein product [Urochloa humidicola]
MSGEMAEKAAAAAAKPATSAFVTFLAGDSWNWKAVVEMAERLREVESPWPLVVVVLPDVPEARRQILVSQGCVVREVGPLYSPEPDNQAHLAMADYVANKLRIRGEFVEYERVVYVKPVMNTISGDDNKAWIIPTAEFRLPPPCFNADTFVLEPSIIIVTARDMLEALRMSPTPVAHHQDFLNMLFKNQYKPIPLEENPALSMLANKASERPLAEKKLPPFSSWLATTKEVIFARKNLPAMAILAASSAAAGVITTAANPAICFGFYVVFIAAIAFVTVSIREI